MNSYFGAMSRYFEFSGRSTRREYWWFQLGVFVLAFVATLVDIAALGYLNPKTGTGLGPLVLFVFFFHFIPGLSVQVRRLHDAGKSGWWHLISIVPFIGALWMLYLSLKGPDENSDDFGPDPRFAVAERRVVQSRAQMMLEQMEERRRRLST